MSGVGTAAAVLGMGGSKSVLHGDLLAPANTQELQAVVGHMEQSYKRHRNISVGNVYAFEIHSFAILQLKHEIPYCLVHDSPDSQNSLHIFQP